MSERVAIVTGASRGIGRAVALELGRRNIAVGCLSRSQDQVAAVAADVEQAGGRAVAAACDVTRDDQVEAAVKAVVSGLGPIDILVNNAGVADSAPFLKTDPAMWERTLDVNLNGTYRMTRAVLSGMLERGWGRVINVASVAARTGFLYTTAYCASKHAVLGLTRALSLEVAERGVTVNAVCPGWVDTEMTEASIARISGKTGLPAAEARKRLEAMSPQKRLMTAEEVAFAVAGLVADDARGINGQAIQVDGGGFLG
ncbi:MAG: SDR family NAD(P)-dependent oxidoreductase [Acidobacteriota bacterium]